MCKVTLNSDVVETSHGKLMVSDNHVSFIEPLVPLRDVSEYLSKALRAASFDTPEDVDGFIAEFEEHFNEVINKNSQAEEERYAKRMSRWNTAEQDGDSD